MPIDVKFGDLAKLFKGWGRSSVKSTGIIDTGSTNTSFKVKDEVYLENQFKNYFLEMITGNLANNYYKITENAVVLGDKKTLEKHITKYISIKSDIIHELGKQLEFSKKVEQEQCQKEIGNR